MNKQVTWMFALGLAALNAMAQNAGGPPGGPGGKPPTFPIVTALDANTNGVIDADEITNATALLKTLDKDGDGKLSQSEYMPACPSGFGTNTNSMQPPPGSQGGGQPPVPPIVSALDTNSDGVIDADELANAPAALKTLDKNSDGKLTEDELRPSGGPGGQQGGPGGSGEQGGPGGMSGGPGGGQGGPSGPPPGE